MLLAKTLIKPVFAAFKQIEDIAAQPAPWVIKRLPDAVYLFGVAYKGLPVKPLELKLLSLIHI